jgi:two-component system chemotaxis response regulator CheY
MHNDAPHSTTSDNLISHQAPRTILLVDDDPDIRSLTRTFLEHEGYKVLTCGDADRASHIFQSAAYVDLLITDFYLPATSGMQLARSLKTLRHDLPVLLISGGLIGLDHLAQLRDEDWHFLGKPFALPELLATVHRILASSITTATQA